MYKSYLLQWRETEAVLVVIIFAVLLGEIDKVDSVAYNSTFAYSVYGTFDTNIRTSLRINRYCSMADFPFFQDEGRLPFWIFKSSKF